MMPRQSWIPEKVSWKAVRVNWKTARMKRPPRLGREADSSPRPRVN